MTTQDQISIPTVVDPVVEPFFVQAVPAENYQGVFGALHTGIDLTLNDLQERWGRQFSEFPYSEFCEILNAIKENVSNERYAEIQRAHIQGPYRVPGHRKYLDTPRFLITAFYNAQLLGLFDGKKRSVLDLASGPSHLPYLARVLGHEVLATDVQWPPTNATGDRHLFQDLRALFGVPFEALSIETRAPIRLGRRFDVVTAMNLGYGISFLADGGVKLWSPADWDWHITDVLENVLNDGGVFCVQPQQTRTDPAAWELIKSRAARLEENRRVAVMEKA